MPLKVKTTFQCIFLKEGLVENTTHKLMKKRKLNLWRLYVVSFSPVNEVKAETQVRYGKIYRYLSCFVSKSDASVKV